MKIAYSSLAAPAWDLETLVAKAVEYGYDGIELRGLRGELHLPLCPDLTRDPQAVQRSLKEHNVELVCLGASATLTPKRRRDLAREKSVIGEFVELAASLDCPFVRVFAGDVGRLDTHQAALARAADALVSLAPMAARYGVTLLVENGGDLSGSADLWFIMDAVNHPSVRVCWNQCHAMTLFERPTNSIPRLGSHLGMVHLCDATFDANGVLQKHVLPGEGDVEIARQIELLKGIIYRGFVTFEWPKLWWASLAGPEVVLPAASAFLRSKIDERHGVLTAYKNDKHAPRLASATTE